MNTQLNRNVDITLSGLSQRTHEIFKIKIQYHIRGTKDFIQFKLL